MPACVWTMVRGCMRCIDGVSRNRVHIKCDTTNRPVATVKELMAADLPAMGRGEWLAIPGLNTAQAPGDAFALGEPVEGWLAAPVGSPDIPGGWYSEGYRYPLPFSAADVPASRFSDFYLSNAAYPPPNPQLVNVTIKQPMALPDVVLNAVSEPTSIALFFVGGFILWLVSRKKRR